MNRSLLLCLVLISFVSTHPIKKFIILVQENHSYDNFLGFMEPPIGDLTGEEYNLLDPKDPSS